MSPPLPASCGPHASLGRKGTIKKIKLGNWAQLSVTCHLHWCDSDAWWINVCIWVTHFWMSALGGLSSTNASHGARHGICLHSRKQIPSYMVYGETYFRRFGEEKVSLPAPRHNLAKAPMVISLAHTPWGLPPPFLTQRLLASGLLGPRTLVTSHSFLVRALHCSPAFVISCLLTPTHSFIFIEQLPMYQTPF